MEIVDNQDETMTIKLSNKREYVIKLPKGLDGLNGLKEKLVQKVPMGSITRITDNRDGTMTISTTERDYDVTLIRGPPGPAGPQGDQGPVGSTRSLKVLRSSRSRGPAGPIGLTGAQGTTRRTRSHWSYWSNGV